MLSKQEETALKLSIKQVKNATKKAIEKANNAEQAITFFGQLQGSVNTVAAKAFKLEPTAKCQAGCAHCCIGTHVQISEPEALYIAGQLRALPKTILDSIIEKLQQHVASQTLINKQSAQKANRSRLACSFLVNNQCSIYEFRPAVCRKAHSLSIEDCENYAETIPQHLQVILESEALISGTTQAYESMGFSSNTVELNAGLLAVLTGKTSKQNWYQAKQTSNTR